MSWQACEIQPYPSYCRCVILLFFAASNCFTPYVFLPTPTGAHAGTVKIDWPLKAFQKLLLV